VKRGPKTGWRHDDLRKTLMWCPQSVFFFFFHFCKVATGATSEVQLVLLWLVGSCCRSSLCGPTSRFFMKTWVPLQFVRWIIWHFSKLLSEKSWLVLECRQSF
jgi:hypothetical protein